MDAIEPPNLEGAETFIQVVCRKCTRVRVFSALTQIAAQLEAKKKGWKFTASGPICKKCPGGFEGNYPQRPKRTIERPMLTLATAGRPERQQF